MRLLGNFVLLVFFLLQLTTRRHVEGKGVESIVKSKFVKKLVGYQGSFVDAVLDPSAYRLLGSNKCIALKLIVPARHYVIFNVTFPVREVVEYLYTGIDLAVSDKNGTMVLDKPHPSYEDYYEQFQQVVGSEDDWDKACSAVRRQTPNFPFLVRAYSPGQFDIGRELLSRLDDVLLHEELSAISSVLSERTPPGAAPYLGQYADSIIAEYNKGVVNFSGDVPVDHAAYKKMREVVEHYALSADQCTKATEQQEGVTVQPSLMGNQVYLNLTTCDRPRELRIVIFNCIKAPSADELDVTGLPVLTSSEAVLHECDFTLQGMYTGLSALALSVTALCLLLFMSFIVTPMMYKSLKRHLRQWREPGATSDKVGTGPPVKRDPPGGLRRLSKKVARFRKLLVRSLTHVHSGHGRSRWLVVFVVASSALHICTLVWFPRLKLSTDPALQWVFTPQKASSFHGAVNQLLFFGKVVALSMFYGSVTYLSLLFSFSQPSAALYGTQQAISLTFLIFLDILQLMYFINQCFNVSKWEYVVPYSYIFLVNLLDLMLANICFFHLMHKNRPEAMSQLDGTTTTTTKGKDHTVTITNVKAGDGSEPPGVPSLGAVQDLVCEDQGTASFVYCVPGRLREEEEEADKHLAVVDEIERPSQQGQVLSNDPLKDAEQGANLLVVIWQEARQVYENSLTALEETWGRAVNSLKETAVFQYSPWFLVAVVVAAQMLVFHYLLAMSRTGTIDRCLRSPAICFQSVLPGPLKHLSFTLQPEALNHTIGAVLDGEAILTELLMNSSAVPSQLVQRMLPKLEANFSADEIKLLVEITEVATSALMSGFIEDIDNVANKYGQVRRTLEGGNLATKSEAVTLWVENTGHALKRGKYVGFTVSLLFCAYGLACIMAAYKRTVLQYRQKMVAKAYLARRQAPGSGSHGDFDAELMAHLTELGMGSGVVRSVDNVTVGPAIYLLGVLLSTVWLQLNIIGAFFTTLFTFLFHPWFWSYAVGEQKIYLYVVVVVALILVNMLVVTGFFGDRVLSDAAGIRKPAGWLAFYTVMSLSYLILGILIALVRVVLLVITTILFTLTELETSLFSTAFVSMDQSHICFLAQIKMEHCMAQFGSVRLIPGARGRAMRRWLKVRDVIHASGAQGLQVLAHMGDGGCEEGQEEAPRLEGHGAMGGVPTTRTRSSSSGHRADKSPEASGVEG